METQQDAVGVAVKVQQRSDQSCQTTELIDLQEETSRQSGWICLSAATQKYSFNFVY